MMYVILCYSLKKRQYLWEDGRCYKIVKKDSPDIFKRVSALVNKLRSKVKVFYSEDGLSAYAFIDNIKRHLRNVFLNAEQDLSEITKCIMNCSNVIIHELSKRLMTSSKKEEMYLILIYDFTRSHLFIIHSSLREALTDRYNWVRTTLDEALSNAFRAAMIFFKNDKLVVGYHEFKYMSKGFREAFGIPVVTRPETGSIQIYGNAVVDKVEMPFPSIKCDLEPEEFIDLVKGVRGDVFIEDGYLMLRGVPYLKITRIQVKDLTFKDVEKAFDYVLKYEAYFAVEEIINSFKENVKVDVYGSEFVDSLGAVISDSTGNVVLSKGELLSKYGILLIFHNRDWIKADDELLGFISNNIAAGKPVRLLFYDIVKERIVQDYLGDNMSLRIGSLNLCGIRCLVPNQTIDLLEFVDKLINDCTSKTLKGLLHGLGLYLLSRSLEEKFASTIIDFLNTAIPKIINTALGEVISESESDYLEFKDPSFFSKDLSELVNRLARKIGGVRFKIIISASDDGRLAFLPSTHPLVKSDVRCSLEQCLKNMLRDYEIKVYAVPKDECVAIVIFAFRPM